MKPNEITVRVLRGREADYTSEARSIQYSARARRPRVVKLGHIVFFSAPSGDAWMLDPADGLAVCLACEGEPRPVPIRETDTRLLVEWNTDYRIEGEAFTVGERNGGASRTILGYPTAEIERMVREYPAAPLEDFSAAEMARARLKTGRNDPCPCGSGRKYKKCCLLRDEASVREAAAAPQSRETLRAETLLPLRADASTEAEADEPEAGAEPAVELDKPGETELSPEVHAKLDDLWDEFDALERPTAEQMDALLAGLLALPPEAIEWNDVFHGFAKHGHSDLPAVFRRIAAAVPHAKATGMSFFYWAAAEEFVRRGMHLLLPDVAAGFRKLDLESYDADALTHVEDWLLAAGCETGALELAEHFLAIERADSGLMPYAVPERCYRIFELRVGQAFLAGPADGQPPDRIAEQLRKNIEGEIHPDAAAIAAAIAAGQAPPEWTGTQFDLVEGNVSSDAAWRESLRLRGTLMRVALEAWQLEAQPPGCTLHGLDLLLNAVDDRKLRKKSKRARDNLLDYLRPEGLEERIVRACPDLIGVNEARARLLLQAIQVLTRSAARHELISAAEADPMEKELSRLQEELDRDTQRPRRA